ncbi:hypothetical protein [Nocardioides sp. GY 10127]|uniref:hypothetical protein n=1 Tax=Nocardioides sp. GY 10127 TaxID=2569762 RepID=UPI0010A9471A|nr:hypothetical protein [Nocardioides sp. GY 10127]TIC81696.1 hypothetical protein E8D37_10900 [Nocardioides sp. GY 10127]
MSTPTPAVTEQLASLLAQVHALGARVERLEAELAETRTLIPPPEVPPEVVLAISAAVAEFLGHRAKVKQVHYRTGAAWAQQGRAMVHGHRIMHGVR